MTKKDLEYFKVKLEKERKILEDELGGIAQTTVENPDKWEATPGSIEVDAADENEVADKMEELEENGAIIKQLSPQLKEVNSALERIKNGTYGICEVSNEPIEKERLEANPAARTCMKHMK